MKRKNISSLTFLFLLSLFVWVESNKSESWGGVSNSLPHIRIPLYAVTLNDNPVDNLGEDELNLYLDNEAVDFILRKCNKAKMDLLSNNRPGKTNIIILDTSLTGLSEFKKSKKIAENIVNKGLPGDTFTILQLSPLTGLHIVVPRETNKDSVIERLDKLEFFPELKEKNKKNAMKSLKHSRSMSSNRFYAPSKIQYNLSMQKIQRMFQKESYYEDQTLISSYFLAKFKNSLQAIEKPKIVFLISRAPETDEGALQSKKAGFEINRADDKYQTFFINYLNDILKEVINSGGLLFRINPVDGSDSTVQQTASAPSAYYELLISRDVNIDVNIKEKIRIELNSKRKGIRLYCPQYTTVGKPYRIMDKFQKRLLLLDVILEEPWTRCTWRVGKAWFNILPLKAKEDNSDEEPHRPIQIKIPKEMRYKNLDVFTIHINPGTRKVDIDFAELFAKEQIVFPFKSVKDNHGFFVVIEPSGFSCIYNEIK